VPLVDVGRYSIWRTTSPGFTSDYPGASLVVAYLVQRI
jgi:hypothetical protein